MKQKKIYRLTAANVQKIFKECLLKENELVDGVPNISIVVGEGIVNNFGFSEERIKEKEEKIVELINQLPQIEEGPSFLSLCFSNDGRQWGEHLHVEQLIALGIASGNLAYCLPREMWEILPGGMPMVIKTNKEPNKTL